MVKKKLWEKEDCLKQVIMLHLNKTNKSVMEMPL